jgi:hypothetical protein
MSYRAAISVTLMSLCSPLALAQLTVSPTSLTFATQAVSTASPPQQVNITNNSSTSVSFSSIQASSDFKVTSTTCSLKTALAASGSCYVRIQFIPAAAGTTTGTLTLVDSDPSSPQQVSLQGVGTAIGLSPASVAFGTQLLNTTSTATPVVLMNAGSTTVTITAIAITGDFQFGSQNCIPAGSSTGTVIASANCTMNIVFVPTALGSRTGTLTITDNGGGSTQTVALTGTGTAVSLSTSTLAFGSQYLQLPSAVQAVTLTNVSSTTTVTVSAITLSLADYSEVSSCIPAGAHSGTVLPKGQCAIYVTFEPTSTGSRAGTMSITSNGGGGTQLVALSGTGAAGVGIALSPGAAAITDTAVLTLTAALTNTTNANVTWLVDGMANGSSSVGTITATGPNTASYTPPKSDGPHTVTANSAASTTSSASMVVTVTDYPGTFTYHNDNARDGQNQQEIVLSPSNVNVAQFGKLFSYPVDGQVYAQPLYVANVNIPGQGFHNVLYVATENDSVYAFDADGLTTVPLWQVSFLSATQNVTPVASTAINANYTDLFPQIGITGTPVIDPAAGTLFVVAKTDDNGTYNQRLHALNIATGEEQANSPVVISASITTDGKNKTFNALLENQRAALLLLNGVVYIAWGSHGDIGTYHGWVIGYDETTLVQQGVYITTPVDSYGGIWQAGGGPAADTSGNIYVTSGNGPDDVAAGGSDYSGALIKLGTTSGLSVADYFKPSTNTTDNSYEMSSGGPVLLPTQTGDIPDIAIVAGKDKNIYLVNRDSLGGASPSGSQLLQTITGAFKAGVFSTPSFWQNNVYFWAETDYLRSFQLQNGQLSATATYPLLMAFPGASTSVSSNRTQNGLLWAIDANAVLHAFDATNVSHEFYNSSEAGTRDTAGIPVKFAVPTIANGKVYVGSANQVSGYGLLP